MSDHANLNAEDEDIDDMLDDDDNDGVGLADDDGAQGGVAREPGIWIKELVRAKAAAEAASKSGAMPFRSAEFWNECAWPMHTIALDRKHATLAGDFAERLFKSGLTPAMNVIVHKAGYHHVGAIFGNHGYDMAFDYGVVDRAIADRKKAQEDGTWEEIRPKMGKQMSKAERVIEGSAYACGIELGEAKPKEFGRPKNFAYLLQLEEKAYPQPRDQSAEGAWEAVGEAAKLLCEKFGLRSVRAPLAFDPPQALAFIGRLDATLGDIAEFAGIEPTLVGLGEALSIGARPPGTMSVSAADLLDDDAAHAEREKAAEEKDDAEAKKKAEEREKLLVDDANNGLFMGNYIQIEIGQRFVPETLVHEWIHALDLWMGSRQAIEAKPWVGSQIFASGTVFGANNRYFAEVIGEQPIPSPKLLAWAKQLAEGGSEAASYEDALPPLSFLMGMRRNYSPSELETYAGPMSSHLSGKLFAALDPALAADSREATREQAGNLAAMVGSAALEHAMDSLNSARSSASLAKARKDFYEEWGDLTGMWAERQLAASPRGEAKEEAIAKAKAQIIQELSGAWSWAALSRRFHHPDVHLKHAMRMDANSGSMRAYYSTPHELLAFKSEEVFSGREKPLDPDDKMGALIMDWLREEAAPALRSYKKPTFEDMMERSRPKKYQRPPKR